MYFESFVYFNKFRYLQLLPGTSGNSSSVCWISYVSIYIYICTLYIIYLHMLRSSISSFYFLPTGKDAVLLHKMWDCILPAIWLHNCDNFIVFSSKIGSAARELKMIIRIEGWFLIPLMFKWRGRWGEEKCFLHMSLFKEP